MTEPMQEEHSAVISFGITPAPVRFPDSADTAISGRIISRAHTAPIFSPLCCLIIPQINPDSAQPAANAAKDSAPAIDGGRPSPYITPVKRISRIAEAAVPHRVENRNAAAVLYNNPDFLFTDN